MADPKVIISVIFTIAVIFAAGIWTGAYLKESQYNQEPNKIKNLR